MLYTVYTVHTTFWEQSEMSHIPTRLILSRKISIFFEFRPFWPRTRKHALYTDETAPCVTQAHRRAILHIVNRLRPQLGLSQLFCHHLQADAGSSCSQQARHRHSSAQGCGGSPWLLCSPPHLREPSLVFMQAPCTEFHHCAMVSALVWVSEHLRGKSNKAWASASLRCEFVRA